MVFCSLSMIEKYPDIGAYKMVLLFCRENTAPTNIYRHLLFGFSWIFIMLTILSLYLFHSWFLQPGSAPKGPLQSRIVMFNKLNVTNLNSSKNHKICYKFQKIGSRVQGPTLQGPQILEPIFEIYNKFYDLGQWEKSKHIFRPP